MLGSWSFTIDSPVVLANRRKLEDDWLSFRGHGTCSADSSRHIAMGAGQEFCVFEVQTLQAGLQQALSELTQFQQSFGRAASSLDTLAIQMI
eukprot:4662810-Amphidinium_carterae.2